MALSGHIRVAVSAQFFPIGSGKDPCLLPKATPVVREEPVRPLGGMLPSRPVQEQPLHELVVSAQGVCWHDPLIVGGPSVNERIEFLNDLGLRGGSQLGQPLTDGGQVAFASFFAGGDHRLEHWRPQDSNLATARDRHYAIICSFCRLATVVAPLACTRLPPSISTEKLALSQREPGDRKGRHYARPATRWYIAA